MELEKARLEVESASGEAERLAALIEATRHRGAAELQELGAKLEHARGRVAQLERDIQAMTVKAPRAGVVVYPSDWRGEKRGVGDTVWNAQVLMQLPDLGELLGEGYVPESDAGRLEAGQPVRLRLDSREGEELVGRLAAIGRSIQPRSWRVRDRVVRVEIELDAEHTGLRPGMRFRGEIETAREAGVLQLPLDAVFHRTEGPVAWRCGWRGCRETRLELGRRNGTRVEVLSGLAPGDAVAREDLALAGRSGA
jgi:multidrug efflux pump subunit AcrA (membrane-fusion protein)